MRQRRTYANMVNRLSAQLRSAHLPESGLGTLQDGAPNVDFGVGTLTTVQLMASWIAFLLGEDAIFPQVGVSDSDLACLVSGEL